MSTIGGNTKSEESYNDCARCRSSQGNLRVRNEHLCKECFLNYVGVKVTKRMESNNLRSNLRDAPKILLLALSLGPSSLTMLHVLDQNIQRQRQKTGRAGYTLKVLLIDSSTDTSFESPGNDTFSLIEQRFAVHTYIRLPLETALDEWPSFPSGTMPSHTKADDSSISRSTRLKNLLADASRKGLRDEATDLLRQRLVASIASKNDVDAVIFGDSTTRLAERTLTETARGNGALVPWLTTDASSPRNIPTIFPMRDLLRKELVLYAELADPPLSCLLRPTPSAPNPPSSRDVSIDRLMQQYFATVEDQYPSIVANVVRTASKLSAPQIDNKSRSCSYCNLTILGEDFIEEAGQVHCRSCRRILIELD